LLTRTFSALRYRDFRLLWIGAFTSTTGTWMQTVAQSWLVFSLTGSAFLLGFDSFLGAAPIILFSLFGGVIADRFPRRRVMIGSQILQMTFAFTLAALILFDRVEVWHIFVLSFLTGTAQAFSGPAYVSLLPTLVSRDDVPNAIAMNSMQFNLARMIGPVVAGFALVAFGAAACFAINGLSFVAVIIALSLMSAAAGTHVARQRKSVMDDLREGIRFVGRNRVLVEVSALGFVGMFLGAPFVTLLPVVAKEVFAEGPKVYSWLLAAYGVGSVLGAVGVAMWSDLRRKGVLALAMQVGFRGEPGRLRGVVVAAAQPRARVPRRRLRGRHDLALQLDRPADHDRRDARPRDVDLHALVPRRSSVRQPSRRLDCPAVLRADGPRRQRRRTGPDLPRRHRGKIARDENVSARGAGLRIALRIADCGGARGAGCGSRVRGADLQAGRGARSAGSFVVCHPEPGNDAGSLT
jgi:MFS family permease